MTVVYFRFLRLSIQTCASHNTSYECSENEDSGAGHLRLWHLAGPQPCLVREALGVQRTSKGVNRQRRFPFPHSPTCIFSVSLHLSNPCSAWSSALSASISCLTLDRLHDPAPHPFPPFHTFIGLCSPPNDHPPYPALAASPKSLVT